MQVNEKFISAIYDCAANPDLWPATLTAIRDHFGAAYAMAGLADLSPMQDGGVAISTLKNSPWDVDWLQSVGRSVADMPGFESLSRAEVDQPWIQLQSCDEKSFKESGFYKTWVGPQKLRDCIFVPLFTREKIKGFLAMPNYDGMDLYTHAQADFAASLAPHLRRALAINDLVDRNQLELLLYRKVLDKLVVPVFIIGKGQAVAVSNAAADEMLSKGNLLRRTRGALTTCRNTAGAFEDAIQRASKGDHVLGIRGIGVPLVSLEGERAAAYILPIAGKDIRGDMGEGYSVVFIARRNEQLPTVTEILRTIFDLTHMEARVAALVTHGDSPLKISGALNISVHTVRTHLQRAFSKTGSRTQTELSAAIHELVPPIAT